MGFVAASSSSASAATTSPKIYVNGNLLSLTSQPIVRNGTTFIPVRQVAEALGLTVVFNSSTNTITFKHPYRSTKVYHKIGSDSVYAAGSNHIVKYKMLQANSVEYSGVTYVPIRLFEAFDATVFWDGGKNSIYIYSYELKQLQAVTFANLSYDNLYSLGEGKDLKDVNFNKLKHINSDFKKVQKYLHIYNRDVNDVSITTDKFLKNYVRLGEWELKAFLSRSDFATKSEYDAMINSGFQGYAFRNYKTNEFMITFTGTQSNDDADTETDKKILFKRSNQQKQYAFKLFQKVTSKYNKPTIYLTGHSLGGNLVEATAANFPNNYKQAFTFNSFGTNNYSNSTKVVSSSIDTDPVSRLYAHYGRVFYFKVRHYEDDFNVAAHKLFNFYGYYLLPNTKYWNNSDFGIPYVYGKPNYLWTY